jgi:hypothetical protein
MLNRLLAGFVPAALLVASSLAFLPHSQSFASSGLGVDQRALTVAPYLFKPFPTQAGSQGDEIVWPGRGREVVKARQVEIELGVLTSVPDSVTGSSQPPQNFALNLFDGVTYFAQADRIEKTVAGIAWIGHLQGLDLSQVILVIHGNIVSGNISAPGLRYHIRFAGGGAHEVQEIDPSRFPRDEPYVPIPGESALGSRAAKDLEQNAQADDGSTIDVMVVYSAAARAGAFGTTAIKGLIDLAITETNQSYLNSGIAQRVRLVHTEELAYSETGKLDDALNCVTSATDGCLDNVQTLRNTYGADLVSFWVETGDGCGIGWLMSSVSPSFESYGFSVVERSCATGYFSFGHELGHNMGARHDAYMDKNTTTPYPYAHGYLNTAAASPWRTIMAYNDACAAVGKTCTRIQYWSNPTISYAGAAMGIAASADDRRALNNTAYTVANFRATVVPNAAASSTVIEFYNTNLDNYFITANASEAAAIDGGSAGPGWSRTGYTFKSGGGAQVCRFYGSQSPGPNSHFYTIDPAECSGLKQLQFATPITQKRWNFESMDFSSTAPVNGSCAMGTVPVYRAYNNGSTRGIDSNHRITNSMTAIQQVVVKGWSYEAVVMCAPN